jgi:transcriptional regulator with XRE-family HTH domain
MAFRASKFSAVDVARATATKAQVCRITMNDGKRDARVGAANPSASAILFSLMAPSRFRLSDPQGSTQLQGGSAMPRLPPLESGDFAKTKLEENVDMVIGERLKHLRESKKMCQGDVEHKTGLLRCYISRVENGHTVPAIETLEKMARAMDIPLYKLFCEDDEKPRVLKLTDTESGWGGGGKDAATLAQFRRLLRRTNEKDRKLLLFMATKMAQSNTRKIK